MHRAYYSRKTSHNKPCARRRIGLRKCPHPRRAPASALFKTLWGWLRCRIPVRRSWHAACATLAALLSATCWTTSLARRKRKSPHKISGHGRGAKWLRRESVQSGSQAFVCSHQTDPGPLSGTLARLISALRACAGMCSCLFLWPSQVYLGPTMAPGSVSASAQIPGKP